MSQRQVQVRALIIDDASSDDTAEVATDLTLSDPRVEFIQHKINRGHIATYNEGLLNWSKADYVVLLSADDMLSPDCLMRATGIMDADKSIGMVYGRAVHFREESELLRRRSGKVSYKVWSGAEWIERRCQSGCNVISSPEVVVRGCVQRSLGGYLPELPHAGDLEMWLRIAAVGDIAYIRRVPQAFYRVHAASMLRTKYKHGLADLQQRKAAFDTFAFNHQGLMKDLDRLHDSANKSLAREALWDACRAYDQDRVTESYVPELVAFALSAHTEARKFPEYGALCRRQRVGPKMCKRTQIFVAAAIVRRVRAWVRRQRRKREGV